MRRVKYAVCPGEVASQTDGDRHYVPAMELMKLYAVSPKECVVLRHPSDFDGIRDSDLTFLHPRQDGNYEPPNH